MFDKSAVDEYRSITAPENLRNRVLQHTVTTKRPAVRAITLVSALAACLVLLFTQTWIGVQDDVAISSNWQLSPASSVAMPVAASSRSGAEYCATLTLAVRDQLQFDTDDTLFVVTDEGDLIDTFPYESSGVVSIYWYITTPTATMTVNGVTYTLYADEYNGTFQIVQD